MREHEGKTWAEACDLVGKDASFSALRHKSTNTTLATDPRPRTEPTTNLSLWRKQAAELVRRSLQYIPTPGQDTPYNEAEFSQICQYLFYERGLCPTTCKTLGIGWNSKREKSLASKWGIKDTDPECQMTIPSGIVIPSKWENEILSVYVHFPKDLRTGKQKGQCLRGTGKKPFLAQGKDRKYIFVMESALDAALVWQELQGIHTTLAFNGATKNTLEQQYANLINAHAHIIYLQDIDENGAGQNNGKHFTSLFPRAHLLRPASGFKDVGEMHNKAMQTPWNTDLLTIRQYAELIFQRVNAA